MPELQPMGAEILQVGGETVSIVYDATNGRFSSSGGNDGLLSEF